MARCTASVINYYLIYHDSRVVRITTNLIEIPVNVSESRCSLDVYQPSFFL